MTGDADGFHLVDDDSPDPYARYLEHHIADQCTLIAFLSGDSELPSSEEVLRRLAASGLPLTTPIIRERVGMLEIAFQMARPNGRQVSIFLKDAPPFELTPLVRETLHIDAESAQLAESRWAVEVDMTYGDMPIQDHDDHLRITAAAATELVALWDPAQHRMRSHAWVQATVGQRGPKGLGSLFVIHSVRDDRDQVWVHTHGLNRCGSIELEVIGVPVTLVDSAARLVNKLAPHFITRPPPAGRPFRVSPSLVLTWMPWEEVIDTLQPESGGGREDRDDEHDRPAGVLFAASREGPRPIRALPGFD